MIQERFITCQNCGKSSYYPNNEAYVKDVTCKKCNMSIDTSRQIIDDIVRSLRGEQLQV